MNETTDKRVVWMCNEEFDLATCVDEEDRDERIQMHNAHWECGYHVILPE